MRKNKMSYKIRENIFNMIMVRIRKILYFIFRLNIHRKFIPFQSDDNYISLLSYSIDKKYYRFNCYCLECPVNENGLCRTTFSKIPLNSYLIHEFDGDNIIRNYCG